MNLPAFSLQKTKYLITNLLNNYYSFINFNFKDENSL